MLLGCIYIVNEFIENEYGASQEKIYKFYFMDGIL